MTVAYDGTNFLGWQKTKMGPSIEEALQLALEQILQEKIELQAASRTDAGVHAQGQIVNFFTSKAEIVLSKLLIGINSLIPNSIAVMTIEKATEHFHPSLDCQSKEYHYLVCNGSAQLPQRRFYSWHYPHLLDLIAMRKAAEMFIGEHDFSSFCNAKKNSSYKTFIRRMHSIEILDSADCQLYFKIKGNNFLYRMVRNIIGTLVYVGVGKILLKEIPEIFAHHNRTQAGVTAPAHGLCLHKVFY